MNLYQAKIEFIPGQSAPDEYDPQSGKEPPLEFVVTRDAKGNVLSRYGDMVWDRAPYDAKGRTSKIYFQYWGKGPVTPERTKLVQEIRWLIFVLIWMSPGSALSNQGLVKYIWLLRMLARAAEVWSLSLKQILRDSQMIRSVISPSSYKPCIALLRTLDWLGPDLTGYKVDHHEAQEALAEDIKAYSNNIKQTVPIPTRLYSEILARLSKLTADYGSVVDQLVGLLKDCHTSGELPARGKAFEELVHKHGLEGFWVRRNLYMSPKGLSATLTECQWLTSLQLQAYTGMRGDEADSLPYDCLEEQSRVGDERVHYVVNGRVTKDASGPRQVRWITNAAGRAAILLAQKLARGVYEVLGTALRKKNHNVVKPYLFVSATAILANSPGRPVTSVVEGRIPIGTIRVDLTSTAPDIRRALSVRIEQSDVDELCRIDPHRHWELEKEFAVGSVWLLRRHQLRRSLALYAQASGLVSLSTLKRQLQHLTQEMTLYYCNGSAFANDFIGETENKTRDKHFATEWRITQPISEGLAYVSHVLLGDQADLFGPHALWNQLHRSDGNSVILVDRNAAIAAVKKGLFRFKPTPLGGCVNPGVCHKPQLSILHVECLRDSCKHMIGKVSKLEKVVTLQRIQVVGATKADPNGFAVRQESADLQVLEDCLAAAKISITKRKVTA